MEGCGKTYCFILVPLPTEATTKTKSAAAMGGPDAEIVINIRHHRMLEIKKRGDGLHDAKIDEGREKQRDMLGLLLCSCGWSCCFCCT